MAPLASFPHLHTDEQIVVVAEGLTMAIGTADAAEQLRRIYGERRTIAALMTIAAPTPAPVTTEGAILNLTHPRNRPSSSRAYGPRPRTGARRVQWL